MHFWGFLWLIEIFNNPYRVQFQEVWISETGRNLNPNMENPSKLNFDQIKKRDNKVKYKQQQNLQYKFIIFIIFSNITSFCQSKIQIFIRTTRK